MKNIESGNISNFGVEVVGAFYQEFQNVISGGTFEGIYYFPDQQHRLVVETGNNEYWVGFLRWDGVVEHDRLYRFDTEDVFVQRHLREIVGVSVFRETYENVGIFYCISGRAHYFIEHEKKVYQVQKFHGLLRIESSQDIDGEWKKWGIRTYGTLRNVVCKEDFSFPHSYTKLSHRKF